MNTNPRLSIGALSELATVNIETIRYYERIGVLPKPLRSPGGHRLYGGEHRQRLIFIRRSRELGFSLGQVRFLNLQVVDASRVARSRASPNIILPTSAASSET